jgi:hypothetical protein
VTTEYRALQKRARSLLDSRDETEDFVARIAICRQLISIAGRMLELEALSGRGEDLSVSEKLRISEGIRKHFPDETLPAT